MAPGSTGFPLLDTFVIILMSWKASVISGTFNSGVRFVFCFIFNKNVSREMQIIQYHRSFGTHI